MESDLSKEVYAALYAPTGGIVCPFELNLALAENACQNGAEFYFDTAVEQIEKTEGGYRIHAGEKTYETRCVVNAAGVYADVFHNMVSEKRSVLHHGRESIICWTKKRAQPYTIRSFRYREHTGKESW